MNPMPQIIWKEDYEKDLTDPQDGLKPMCVWWEDMRPNEVRMLVQDAYERGFKRGWSKRQKNK